MENKGKIHYAWFILAACCLLQTAILGIVQNCRGIFYDPVCSDLGLETSAFTLYSLFHGAASFLSMPLTTRFLDRVHPRIALLVTLTLFCGSTALMGSVSTLPAFYRWAPCRVSADRSSFSTSALSSSTTGSISATALPWASIRPFQALPASSSILC